MNGIYPISDLNQKLNRFIANKGQSDAIVAYFLFGSYAVGKATPISDIDVAVLLDKSVSTDFLSEKLRLTAELTQEIEAIREMRSEDRRIIEAISARVIKHDSQLKTLGA